MKKKIVSLALAVCLLAVAIVGGTLAYFTDTEKVENVFTIGDVDVQLIESFYHRAGAYMENVPAQYQLPAGEYINDATIEQSAAWYEAYLDSVQLMPGTDFNKMPYVKNTGKSDAYIRIRVLIPKELDVNILGESVTCTTARSSGEFTLDPAANGEYFFGATNVPGYEDYAVYEFTRTTPLAPGEMTYWNVWNTIEMNTTVTNQDIEALNLEDLKMSVFFEVDAIQADGLTLAEAWAAFEAQTDNSVSEEDYSADAKEGFLTGELE